MSALAGICQWDGRPIAAEDLAVLAEHGRVAGPDGGGTVSPAPGIALQAHVLHFDRCSAHERQPHLFGGGSVLTWDGRLDNREELLVTLHQHLGPERSDAALVAAAYQRWGLDTMLGQLVGDWSFVLWDANQRRLVLARDYMGNRPLYYHETSESLAWASQLEALADCRNLLRHPDESYIAGKLTYGVPPDVTPFHGVRALRGGHVLVASRGQGINVRRYWTFTPATIRYTNPQEYTDHLRVLLMEAVRVRLRAAQTVWAHLSGGWDSSSVVCLAHALIAQGCVDAPAIQPLSLVTSSSPESDETPFIQAVERWCNLSTVREEFSAFPSFAELLGQRQPFAALHRRLKSNLRASHRIMLSGSLGDLVMLRGGGSRTTLLEPLHQGHPLRALRLCFTRARAKQRPLLDTLVRLAVSAYLPASLRPQWAARRRVAAMANWAGVSRSQVAAAFGVTPTLLAKAPRPTLAGPPPTDFPIAKRNLVSTLYRMADRRASPDLLPYLWQTDPYAHRPLVEFMVATPGLAFWAPDVQRAGMRQALADILPPEILARSTKGDPTAVLMRASRDWSAALAEKDGLTVATVSDWELVKQGYLDKAALAKALSTWRTDAWQSDQHVPRAGQRLTKWVHLEAWLRTIADCAQGRQLNTDLTADRAARDQRDVPVALRTSSSVV